MFSCFGRAQWTRGVFEYYNKPLHNWEPETVSLLPPTNKVENIARGQVHACRSISKWVDPAPSNTWSHGLARVYNPKRHIDRFIRFCVVHACDRQTPVHRPRYVCNDGPHLVLCIAMLPSNVDDGRPDMAATRAWNIERPSANDQGLTVAAVVQITA